MRGGEGFDCPFLPDETQGSAALNFVFGEQERTQRKLAELANSQNTTWLAMLEEERARERVRAKILAQAADCEEEAQLEALFHEERQRATRRLQELQHRQELELVGLL